MIPKTPSFIKHLKRIQFFTLMPLSLNSRSFFTVSCTYTFWTIITLIFNVLHHWVPELALQWDDTGPFSASLYFLMKIIYSALPAIYLTTTIRNRFKLERSTKRLLRVLRMLGMWTYPMHVSCIVFLAFYGIALAGFMLQVIGLFYSKTTEILPFIDVVLWHLLAIYIISWSFQFVYTVRTIQECYAKLPQTIAEELNLYFHIFHRLIDISADTNEFYDIPVSITLTLFLLNFVDYTNVAFSGVQLPLGQQLFLYLATISCIAMLTCILSSCHLASAQANCCNDQLLKHLDHTKNPAFQDHPHLIIHLCAKKDLEFKAFKSFTINYDLGSSMIAAYLTYVIVMFQLDHPPSTSSLAPDTMDYNSTLPVNSSLTAENII
ncbi:hypothetical protein GE061_018049 [Apolygus lucorum]|uniref:Gustatory receptor n=1 Tax=Apolygus lucorum TaxID=248454 RepID=A0A6A4J6B4_APOLU|nr:hypothetical protein GE061_018049 [Apolygus lucorum]